MRHDVEPHPPCVWNPREEELARIKDRGHRTAQHRCATVCRHGLPERQPTARPLLLHTKIQGVVEVRRVPHAELHAAEENPAVACDDERGETDEADDPARPPTSSRLRDEERNPLAHQIAAATLPPETLGRNGRPPLDHKRTTRQTPQSDPKTSEFLPDAAVRPPDREYDTQRKLPNSFFNSSRLLTN